VTRIVSLNGYSERDVLALAAAVESFSEHPVARATVARALHDGVEIPRARDFSSEMGRGAVANVDGARVFVGNSRWFLEKGALSLDARAATESLTASGESPFVVATENGSGLELVGLISVADQPRPDAKNAVAAMHRTGVRHVAVVTGDTRQTAEAVASAVGADEVLAELLPEEKSAAMIELRRRFGPVAMVGDGVNDAPAFAAADIGIAMGVAGTDVALETADMALMRDDLSGVAYALELSRRTTRIIKQNITLSLAVKVFALVLAVFGVVNLWIAVAADMGTSLLVTLNGLRLAVDRHFLTRR
jgi:Zn2+/Cd2+-exporting ATPase